MGLISKVLYLKETKDLIEEGLINVGSNITEYDTFRSYPDIVDDLYNNWPRVTASGESVTLDQTMEAPLNIDLKGNTSQEGTPTPSSPIPVNVVSGDNTITISNDDNAQSQNYPLYLGVENLFDYSATPTASSGATDIQIETITNGIKLTSKSTNTWVNARYLIMNIENYPNGKMTLSCNINGTYTNARRVNIVSCDSTGNNRTVLNSIETTQNGYFTATATLPSTFTSTNNYLMLIFYSSTGTAPTVGNYIEYTNIQLELGSKANSYTPYGTTPIELCKIGDYQDYIYKTDKWYLHKETSSLILRSTYNWQDRPAYSYADRFVIDAFFPTTKTQMYSKYFVFINLLSDTYPYMLNNGTQLVCNFSAKGTTTLAQFKTWLDTNEPKVYYILSNATDSEITDIALITQLEALKGAMSYEGQTNISQVNNDKPFIITAEALKGSAE